MYEPVQKLGRLGYLFLVFIYIYVGSHLLVKDHFEGTVIMSNLRSQAAKVEVVLDVVFIHFTKELVAFQATKPLDPCSFLSFRFCQVFRVIGLCPGRHSNL